MEAIASLIDEDSEFVFDALDDKKGPDHPNGNNSKGHDISYRDEPVAFFFVLFGISFEALTRAAAQPSVSRQRLLDILQVMQKILRPSVAGMAIYQDHIFSELMDALDRLALTEGYDVQTAIVEIARDLCTGHPSARKSSASAEDDDHLADDIDQLFELTRLVVLVISSHVPSLSLHHPVRSELPEQVVHLVVLALDALVDAARVFPLVIRSDLHACTLHIFSTILSSAACQETLAPAALPIFRRFLIGMTADPLHDTYSQLRSALARLITVLKTAQRRESSASLPCEKNTLLATTILLTSCSSIFDPQDPLPTRFIDELIDCLGNRMTTKVAAGLSRSLLILPLQQRTTSASSDASTQPTAATAISAHLLPRILDFLIHPSDVEDTDASRSTLASALTTYALTIPNPSSAHKSTAVALTTSTLLRRAHPDVEGQKVWSETAARLLEMAGGFQEIFRQTVGRLSSEGRSLLEEILRAHAGSAGRERKVAEEEERGEPSIALKMDF